MTQLYSFRNFFKNDLRFSRLAARQKDPFAARSIKQREGMAFVNIHDNTPNYVLSLSSSFIVHPDNLLPKLLSVKHITDEIYKNDARPLFSNLMTAVKLADCSSCVLYSLLESYAAAATATVGNWYMTIDLISSFFSRVRGANVDNNTEDHISFLQTLRAGDIFFKQSTHANLFAAVAVAMLPGFQIHNDSAIILDLSRRKQFEYDLFLRSPLSLESLTITYTKMYSMYSMYSAGRRDFVDRLNATWSSPVLGRERVKLYIDKQISQIIEELETDMTMAALSGRVSKDYIYEILANGE